MTKFGDFIAKKLGQSVPKSRSKKPKPQNINSKTDNLDGLEYTIEDYYAFQRGENIFEGGPRQPSTSTIIEEETSETEEPVNKRQSTFKRAKRQSKKRQAKKKAQKKNRSFLEALTRNLEQTGYEFVGDPSEYSFRKKDPSKELPPPENNYVTAEQPTFKLDIERTLGFLRKVRSWIIKLLVGVIQKELNERFVRLQEIIDLKVGELEERVMGAINKAQDKLSNINWTYGGGGSTQIIQQLSGTSTDQLWEEFETSVLGSDDGILDEILVSSLRSSKYIVEAEDSISGTSKRMEVSTLNMGGSLCHSVFNKMGNLDVTVDFLDIAGTATLVINNNSVNDITARTFKLSIAK